VMDCPMLMAVDFVNTGFRVPKDFSTASVLGRGLGKVLRSVHDTSKRGVERESISIEV
jgi:hypothetical protein